jgi:methyl-accepting chemotaxis protein
MFEAWIHNEMDLLKGIASKSRPGESPEGKSNPFDLEGTCLIANSVVGHGWIEALAVVDKSGKVLDGVQTWRIPSDVIGDLAGKEGVRIALDGLYVSIRIEEGGIIAKSDETQLREFMEGLKFGNTGRIYVVSDKAMLSPNGPGKTQTRLVEKLKSEMEIKWDETTSPSGERVISTGRWLPEYEIGFVGELNADEVYFHIRRLKLGVIAILSTLALLFAGSSLLTVTRIASPIRRLTEAAHRVAQGDMEVKIEIRGKDDLAILGEAFNRMISSLRGIMEAEQTQRRKMEEAVRKFTEFTDRVAQGDLSAEIETEGLDENLVALADRLNEMARKIAEMHEKIAQSARIEREGKEALQRRVSEYIQFIERVSSGDLSGRITVESDDEINVLGLYLNGMVEKLHEMVAKLKDTADKVSSMSGEVLEVVMQHSSNAEEQYAAINEVTATMEEMRQTSENVSELAGRVLEVAKKAVGISSSGGEAVQEMIDGVYNMKERIESIAQSILSLSEQIQSIAEITATVSNIAEQSKLLAFNAAIEASKAGEYGRGFSVIASEIRSLAEQSQEATTQIRQILSDIQHAANSAVMITEEGIKQAEQGIKLANQAGEVIRDLTEIIEESANSAENIANAISQQKIGVDQIASAIQNINETTKENLENLKRIESAVQDLNELSEELRKAINRYTGNFS